MVNIFFSIVLAWFTCVIIDGKRKMFCIYDLEDNNDGLEVEDISQQKEQCHIKV